MCAQYLCSVTSGRCICDAQQSHLWSELIWSCQQNTPRTTKRHVCTMPHKLHCLCHGRLGRMQVSSLAIVTVCHKYPIECLYRTKHTPRYASISAEWQASSMQFTSQINFCPDNQFLFAFEVNLPPTVHQAFRLRRCTTPIQYANKYSIQSSLRKPSSHCHFMLLDLRALLVCTN